MHALRFLVALATLLVGCAAPPVAVAAPRAQLAPVQILVDATEAPRGLLHARLVVPARPGELALFYPKWIPGEHGPTGPIGQIGGLRLRAGGQPIGWRRASEEMFEVRTLVPAGASAIEVDLDFILPTPGPGRGGASSTANLLVLNWNQVLVYPKATPVRDLVYAATLRLPAGWRYASALPVVGDHQGTVVFQPVPLETLVDAPLAAGRHLRSVALGPDRGPAHHLHVVADSAEALALGDQQLLALKQLVVEAGALFGAYHYRVYHFLYTLSDALRHGGLEHHESSDNRGPERALVDEDPRRAIATLLPHELVHSWNGKYRRPRGLATGDYHTPMRGELLWIYEGLTTYLGWVLAARSGLRTEADQREQLAATAAELHHAPGRLWRSLEDTAVAAQILYATPTAGRSLRRSVDFYPEGILLWLDADVLIRQKTGGQRSLDDFCRAFFGGTDGPPEVKPYELADALAALGAVAPHDWAGFFAERVSRPTAEPPFGGITGGGWRLAYDGKPNEMVALYERLRKHHNLFFSIGAQIGEGGEVADVIPGMPAARAGLAPEEQVLAIGGRRFSKNALADALARAKTSPEPIEVVAQKGDFVRTIALDYHGGERHPHLERVEGQPDHIGAILAPRTPRPPGAVAAPSKR
jgi:predicted metalloprotease with PDZ domain